MGSEPPEIVVISDDDDGATDWSLAGPPRARRWALLAIGAVLVFAAGVGLGAHLTDDQAANGPAPKMSSTAPLVSTGASPSSVAESGAESTVASATPESARSSTSSSGPADRAVRHIEVGTPPLPGSIGWELFGYRGLSHNGFDAGSLLRYRPDGLVVTAPVPPLYSSTLGSFVVTDSGAIVVPADSSGDAYVIPDEGAVTSAPSVLVGPIFPAGDGRQVWTVFRGADDAAAKLVLATLDGTVSTESVLHLPQVASPPGLVDLSTDGSGYVLATGVGGVYDVRPEGTNLVTHGQLLAVGPTAHLVWECDDTGSCGAVVIDKASGQRHTLHGFTLPGGLVARGMISPDGRRAALVGLGAGGPIVVRLIDLATGDAHTIGVTLPQSYLGSDSSTLTAFTPDGRYLLVATKLGVLPIDTTTGATLDALPIPPVDALAIRPAR